MDNVHTKRSPLRFFLLVYGLSVPFWILGAIAPDFTKIFPMKLPISALMTFCPLLAAVMLVHKERGSQGVKKLLSRTFDFKRIKNKWWYMLIVFLMPVIAVLAYWLTTLTSIPTAGSSTPVVTILLFFVIYFIGAIGEEIGWIGYATDPLQNKYGALKASVTLGSVWAIWHIIPWSQTHQTPAWIIWQSISTIFLRIIMVWLFNNTGKSVFSMVFFHSMINISPYLILGDSTHYNPFLTCILLAVIVIIIVLFWGSKTLTRYRYD